MEINKVIFRKTKDSSEIVAIFPYSIADLSGSMTCYAHVGQHSACSVEWYRNHTKMATPKEYAALKKELEGLGYKLEIGKRFLYANYAEAVKELRTKNVEL